MSAETALEVGMVCGKGETGIGTAEVKANVCEGRLWSGSFLYQIMLASYSRSSPAAAGPRAQCRAIAFVAESGLKSSTGTERGGARGVGRATASFISVTISSTDTMGGGARGSVGVGGEWLLIVVACIGLRTIGLDGFTTIRIVVGPTAPPICRCCC